jgi:hypothetical protein
VWSNNRDGKLSNENNYVWKTNKQACGQQLFPSSNQKVKYDNEYGKMDRKIRILGI